jgi:hypothetical protein
LQLDFELGNSNGQGVITEEMYTSSEPELLKYCKVKGKAIPVTGREGP